MTMKILSSRVALCPFLITLCCGSSPANNNKAVNLGTTLVAIRFDKGVVVGADTRTSVGTYVSHRYAHKIVPISTHCVMARSGSAADTQHLAEAVKQHLISRSYRIGETLAATLNVGQIAHWLQSRVYESSSNGGGVVSLLVAGYDPVPGVARLYTLAPSGALLETQERFAVAGSGSSYIVGYLDDCVHDDLDEQRATTLCLQALALAMSRDASSGGLCRLTVVTDKGTRKWTVRPPPLTGEQSPETTQEDARSRHLDGFAPASFL